MNDYDHVAVPVDVFMESGFYTGLKISGGLRREDSLNCGSRRTPLFVSAENFHSRGPEEVSLRLWEAFSLSSISV